MVRHLFLDLEDTIITPVLSGWRNVELINVEKVNSILHAFKPHFIHLFSFAIWNKQELAKFNELIRSKIENALGIRFCTTWTVDEDIIPMCCKIMSLNPLSVSFAEVSEFWSKHEAFRLCMRKTFHDTHQHKDACVEVMLLDDAVLNETFAWPDLCVSGHIVNIDNPMEPWNAFDRTNNS